MTDFSTQRAASGAPSVKRRSGGRGLMLGGVAVLLLIVGAVGGIVLQNVLSSSGNETRISTYQDWRVTCPPVTEATPSCALAEDVQRNTGGLLMSLSILDTAPSKPLTITVPHGVLLDPGVGFTIGTEPMRVRPYETCTAAGCFAQVTLDADTLKSMRSNTGGQVTIAVPGSTNPVSLPYSLRGFADGYAALEHANGRRTGLFRFLYR